MMPVTSLMPLVPYAFHSKSEMCVVGMIYYDDVGRQLDGERLATTDSRYVEKLRKMFPEMTNIA